MNRINDPGPLGLACLLAIGALLQLSAGSASAAETQRPNVVFFLADDLGYHCHRAVSGTTAPDRLDRRAGGRQTGHKPDIPAPPKKANKKQAVASKNASIPYVLF